MACVPELSETAELGMWPLPLAEKEAVLDEVDLLATSCEAYESGRLHLHLLDRDGLAFAVAILFRVEPISSRLYVIDIDAVRRT